ncbi:MAG: NAD(P)H-binding protein [Bryobacteraceae bacterium]|nr:NAD(P)H-binding protein [Bryobacteraceae bacterium]
MIVVTGGNGQLGRAIATELERAVGTRAFRLSVRERLTDDPRQARGIESRVADYDNVKALSQSFEGADQLILISADGTDDLRLPRQLNAVQAAKDAGVKHIVFTSSRSVGKGNGLAHAAVNSQTEDAIKATGGDYTIMRNSLYAELLLMFAQPAIETGVISLPAANGKAAMISRTDIARFAARVVLPGFGRNQVYELTGPKAFGYYDLAAILAETTGKRIVYVPADKKTAVDWLKGRLAVPDFYLPFIVDAAYEFGQGWQEAVLTDFEQVVGSPATPADQVWRHTLTGGGPLTQASSTTSISPS